MSIYGIAHSLERRDLGPAQLLPNIDDFRGHAQATWSDAHRMLVALEKQTRGSLRDACERLAAEVARVTSAVDELLGGARRLGARERLELERGIRDAGGELAACHRMLGVMAAAVAPRPIHLSLSDLARARWGPKSAFVARRIELCMAVSQPYRFVADPQVAWAIVEQRLAELPEDMTIMFVQIDETDVGALLRLGDHTALKRTSLVRSTRELGPRLPGEADIIDALASHLGWECTRRDDEFRIVLPRKAA